MKKITNKIYQTWYTNNINEIIKQKINTFLEINPGYEYNFYNDEDMDSFIGKNFSGDIIDCYNKLNIRAAKADFWRYLILYKEGGIYIDIDSIITKPLDSLILNNDDAIISVEDIYTKDGGKKNYCINWAMMFSKEHPILKKTIDFLINNVKNNIYPNNIYKTTGPAVLTRAINYIHLKTYNEIIDIENINETYDKSFYYNGYSYRIFGFKYNGIVIHKFDDYHLLYENTTHWTILQNKINLIT